MQTKGKNKGQTPVKDVLGILALTAVITILGVLAMGRFGLLCAVCPLGMLVSAALRHAGGAE